MANEIDLKINNYTDCDAWTEAVAESIDLNIKLLFSIHDEINVLLSGGSTPGPVYRKLDSEISSFKKLKIGLVDERFVPTNDAHSNEKLIKKCFVSRPANEYNIVGMVKDDIDEVNNLAEIKTAYAPFIKRTDLVILGMGGDGHTASIFPLDSESDAVLTNGITGIFSTRAPSEPKKRITCSLDLICNARHIYLLISGAEKLDVLKDFQSQFPIHKVLEKRPDVAIYYLEK